MSGSAINRARVGWGIAPQPESCLEAMHVVRANNDGVDVSSANRRPIQRHITFDIDPPHAEAQSTLLTDHVVDAQLDGQPKGIVQIEDAKRRRLFKERGVVQTDTRVRFEITGRREVIIQRHGWRQMADTSREADASDGDVVLERGRGQQLDTQVVANEVFDCQTQLRVVINRGRTARKGSVTGFRVNIRRANTNRPIALRLRQNRRRQKAKSSCACGNHGKLFHGDLNYLLDAQLYHHGFKQAVDLDQENHVPRCGIRAHIMALGGHR